MLVVPAERSARGDYEMGSGCVVNILNPAVDWPPLQHTLTGHDYNLGQDDHWVCPHMLHDFDLYLTLI